MKRWIEVSITQDHIDKARTGDCYACLVALALRDATGYVWHVMPTDARIETYGRKPVWTFPPDVRRLVQRFDEYDTIEPCSFRLPARFASDCWRGMGADVEAA